MSRKSTDPQSSHHIAIMDSDWQLLSEAFGPGSPNPIGVSAAIRTIVGAYCRNIRARAQGQEDSQSAGQVPDTSQRAVL